MRIIMRFEAPIYDEEIGRTTDYPPVYPGSIIKFDNKVYRVMDVSSNRNVVEIYVSSRPENVSKFATPDWTLEVLKDGGK